MNCDPEMSDQGLISNHCLVMRHPGIDEIFGSGVGFSEIPWIGGMLWVDEISRLDEIPWIRNFSWFCPFDSPFKGTVKGK